MTESSTSATISSSHISSFGSLFSSVQDLAEIILSYADDEVLRALVLDLNGMDDDEMSEDAKCARHTLRPTSQVWYLLLQRHMCELAYDTAPVSTFDKGLVVQFPPYDCTIPYMDLYYHGIACANVDIHSSPTAMGRMVECVATQCDPAEAEAHTYGHDDRGSLIVSGYWSWRDSVIELLAVLAYINPTDCILAAAACGCSRLVDRIMTVYAPNDMAKYRAGDTATEVDEDDDSDRTPYQIIYPHRMTMCMIGALVQSPIPLTGNGTMSEGYKDATNSPLRPTTLSIQRLWGVYGPTIRNTVDLYDNWTLNVLRSEGRATWGDTIPSYLPSIILRNALEVEISDTSTETSRARFDLFEQITGAMNLVDHELETVSHWVLRQVLTSPYLHFPSAQDGEIIGAWQVIDNMWPHMYSNQWDSNLDAMLAGIFVTRASTLSGAQTSWFFTYIEEVYTRHNLAVIDHAPTICRVYNQFVVTADAPAVNARSPDPEVEYTPMHSSVRVPTFTLTDEGHDTILLTSHVAALKVWRRAHWEIAARASSTSLSTKLQHILTNAGVSSSPSEVTVAWLKANGASIVSILLSSLDEYALLGSIWATLCCYLTGSGKVQRINDYQGAILLTLLAEAILDGMHHIITMDARARHKRQHQIVDASIEGLDHLCRSFNQLIPSNVEWEQIMGAHLRGEDNGGQVGGGDRLIWPRNYIARRMTQYMMGGRSRRLDRTLSGRELDVYVMVANLGQRYNVYSTIDLLHPLTTPSPLSEEGVANTMRTVTSQVGSPMELIHAVYSHRNMRITLMEDSIPELERLKYETLVWNSNACVIAMDMIMMQRRLMEGYGVGSGSSGDGR